MTCPVGFSFPIQKCTPADALPACQPHIHHTQQLITLLDAPIPVYFACDMRSYSQFTQVEHLPPLHGGLRCCTISLLYFTVDYQKRRIIRLIMT